MREELEVPTRLTNEKQTIAKKCGTVAEIQVSHVPDLLKDRWLVELKTCSCNVYFVRRHVCYLVYGLVVTDTLSELLLMSAFCRCSFQVSQTTPSKIVVPVCYTAKQAMQN